MSNKQMTIPLKYEESDNYIETYATGIHGGLGPHGELHMYFVEDIIPHPNEQSISVDEKGRAIFESLIKINHFIRKIKCRISINPNDIPAIITWLNSKYEEYNNNKFMEKDKNGK